MQISRRGRVCIEAVPFSRDHSSVYALFIMSELFEKNNDGRRIEGFGTKKKFRVSFERGVYGSEKIV